MLRDYGFFFLIFKAANIIIYASQSNLKFTDHFSYLKSIYLLTAYLAVIYFYQLLEINKMIEIFCNG